VEKASLTVIVELKKFNLIFHYVVGLTSKTHISVVGIIVDPIAQPTHPVVGRSKPISTYTTPFSYLYPQENAPRLVKSSPIENYSL
jgi:hypothetical protein